MHIVLMTDASQPTTEVLPALGLLNHHVRIVPARLDSLLNDVAGNEDVVIVDARMDLAGARTLCKMLSSTGV
ncbi:MAG: DNA-binding response regulator, partial [Geodermatophilaceae bacterium]|nr:DNA-binding response regulator [Geodermatophilaceae bacterium]